MEENTEISKSNKIKIIVVTALIFLVSIAGISYAYFTIQVTGNDTASSMRLRTANMQLIYTDIQILSGEYATPGWTQTKTLTVENVGNVEAYYNIVWRDLINEITNGELVISATCAPAIIPGYTVDVLWGCDSISETIVPTSLSETHNISVYRSIPIKPGIKHTYTLTATFKDTGSNQNYNQNKYFNGTLNITDGHEPLALVRTGTDSTTGLPVVRAGTTEEFYDITNAVNYNTLISTNGNIYNYASGKSVLLAKNNLDTSTGVQATTSGSFAVPFCGSSNNYGYWYDSTNNRIKSQYGSSWSSNNVYDAAYNAAPNNGVAFYNNAGNAGYSVAYYVENYLNELGIVDSVGRLLTYTEANAMTQTQRANGRGYWLGSSDMNNGVHEVYGGGTVGGDTFYISTFDGVRPVIVVNTSDISS